MKTVDVIIPTYKPNTKFFRLLEMLSRQTVSVSHIIVVNTDRSCWMELVEGRKIPVPDDILKVIHITPEAFDHGGTRRMAVSESYADYFVMMTQDAICYDEHLIEELIRPFADNPMTAVSYARQLPAPEASVTERYVRSFNYPDRSEYKSIDDLDRLGIKTFFCSNVCAAYRRDVYDELGGFVEKTIFNEDMIYASKAVRNGFLISYCADAKVYHSHNYSGSEQLHRNFDLAVSQTEHPEVFEGLKSEGEGFKLVKGCISYLKDQKKIYLVPGFIWNCGCRYIGFRLGKMYKKLPMSIIKKLTSNQSYWD